MRRLGPHPPTPTDLGRQGTAQGGGFKGGPLDEEEEEESRSALLAVRVRGRRGGVDFTVAVEQVPAPLPASVRATAAWPTAPRGPKRRAAAQLRDARPERNSSGVAIEESVAALSIVAKAGGKVRPRARSDGGQFGDEGAARRFSPFS